VAARLIAKITANAPDHGNPIFEMRLDDGRVAGAFSPTWLKSSWAVKEKVRQVMG
jgi:hypothetical protein